MTLNAIRARHNAYGKRGPAPVIARKDADQMHADIAELLARLDIKSGDTVTLARRIVARLPPERRAELEAEFARAEADARRIVTRDNSAIHQ